MTIKWPKEWDPNEGWTTSTEGSLNLKQDPRSIASLTRLLRPFCVTFAECRARIGGPGGLNRTRTLEEVDRDLLDYYKKTGKKTDV